MASKEEVRKGLERVAAKLDNVELNEYFKKFQKIVQFEYKDIDLSYVMEISGGKIKELREGSVNRPNIVVKLDSDTFLAILNEEVHALDAYSAGKIKFKGAMTDLLKLQRLL
jgi:putative sterol carrier protein